MSLRGKMKNEKYMHQYIETRKCVFISRYSLFVLLIVHLSKQTKKLKDLLNILFLCFIEKENIKKKSLLMTNALKKTLTVLVIQLDNDEYRLTYFFLSVFVYLFTSGELKSFISFICIL
jgi:hypothetical protein